MHPRVERADLSVFSKYVHFPDVDLFTYVHAVFVAYARFAI